MEGNQSNAAPPAASPPRLLDQVRNAIRRKHYSIRTERAYIHWIKRFIYFSGKCHPKDMGAAEVTAFLNHLSGECDIAAALTRAEARLLLPNLRGTRWLMASPLDRLAPEQGGHAAG